MFICYSKTNQRWGKFWWNFLFLYNDYEFFRKSLKGIRLWLCNIKRNVVSYISQTTKHFPLFLATRRKSISKLIDSHEHSSTYFTIYYSNSIILTPTPENTFVELIYCTVNLHVLGHCYSLQNFTFIYQPAQQ